ncbi:MULTISPECIES: glycine oxidase ThiO [Bacillus]|uniref:glycine oxidase ThiO n=1 Tax=Bacillus TaxID=1386 RepID=UPI002E1AD6AE|nr:glycine oxidase ThiO [Bacillus smithii]MED4883752.1 glycine oxidase ThiO [Bacillus smithii]MED4928523.1 glycine oxidase ThiO [Bacillus smithii]
MQKYDVIIIGGGINGGSIAYQLSKRNYRVAVLEKERIASEASSAAAGMLGAQVEPRIDGAFFDFARKSRDYFDQLVPEIEQVSDQPVEFLKNGMLRIAFSEEEANMLKERIAWQQEQGEPAEWLSADQVYQMEPELKAEIVGAASFPKDGQVMPAQLTKAFFKGASNLGADIYEFTWVKGLLGKNGVITGVETTSGRFYAEHIVIAAGAFTPHLSLPDGASLPTLTPVKGEILAVRPEKPIITSTIYSPTVYIVPKANGEIFIGATEREGIYDKKVSFESIRRLSAEACRIVPALRSAEWSRAWAGVRPQTIDGLPYLGPHPDFKGLWLAAGHFRNGILLSALTGVWMADQIEGKADHLEWKDAFDPGRHSQKGVIP